MMQLKKKISFNSSIRHQITIQKNLLSKYNNIVKNLIFSKLNSGGRNNTGRITVRHKGGSGIKKKFHFFNFSKQRAGLCLHVMYNKNSNSFSSLNFDLIRKIFFKSITVKNVYSGCLLQYKNNLPDFKLGYKAYLSNLPVGSLVHNVFYKKNVICSTSAGSYCQIIQKKEDLVRLKFPSGILVNVKPHYSATLGIVDNIINRLTQVGKAGRNRLRNIRPSVRGIAMNPVDHPHGGKSNKGMHPVTPWGLPTRNKKTSKKKICLDQNGKALLFNETY